MKKKSFKDSIVFGLVMGAILGAFAAIMYIQWQAYFQRFPDAEWWTFFVR